MYIYINMTDVYYALASLSVRILDVYDISFVAIRPMSYHITV